MAGGNAVTASGVEQFQFSNGSFLAGAIVDDAPIGVDDTDTSLVEDGATPVANGNVLGTAKAEQRVRGRRQECGQGGLQDWR